MPNDRAPAGHPDRRWTLLYDADCGFCKWIVAVLLAWDRHDRLAPRAIQSERGQGMLSDLLPEQRLAAMHLVTPEGERLTGGSALAPLLRLLPGGAIPAAPVARLPEPSRRAYEWVASHRTQISRAVPTAVRRRASERVLRAEGSRTP